MDAPKDKLTLVSDNPVYHPYTVKTEDVLEMWQAQMVISKANQQQRWDMGQLGQYCQRPAGTGSFLKKEDELTPGAQNVSQQFAVFCRQSSYLHGCLLYLCSLTVLCC